MCPDRNKRAEGPDAEGVGDAKRRQANAKANDAPTQTTEYRAVFNSVPALSSPTGPGDQNRVVILEQATRIR